MYMTDQQRLSEARALSVALDRMTRSPKRVWPSAPWIIPATMIFVAVFAIVCMIIKLFMNYLNVKGSKTKNYGMSHASSPDIATTPDQASMATTASMKTRGSLRYSSRRRRNRLPPVSLYQMKQKQSPGSSGSKIKHKAALKALSKAAKAEANRSLSRDSTRQVEDDNSDDNINNGGDNSPNLSERSMDTDEIQANVTNQSGLAYAASRQGLSDETDGAGTSSGFHAHSPGHSANQPEVHIVQIRDLEDNLQHSQPAWPQTESEI